MRRIVRLRALAATTLAAGALCLPSTTADAAAAHATGITAPTEATVGETVDVTVDITNTSTAPETAAGHTITEILVVPSCGAPGPNGTGDCPSPDPGALLLGSSGAGVAGTACEGVTFAIAPEPGSTTGRQRLTPSDAVVLSAPSSGAASHCTISLDITIAGAPGVDAFAAAGLQTVVLASSVGTSNLSPTPGSNTTSFASGAQPITIVGAEPTIATSVVASEVLVGEPVADEATIAGGADPTGTVTFDLFGPDDTDCSEAPLASSSHPVAGAGTYASSATTPSEPGEYRFVASYSGDADNQPAAGACGDPNESVVVAAAEPPGIRILKVATPLSRPEPGGTFSFQLAITNTSAVPLTLSGLTDDVYGDVATQGTCTSAIGTTLGPGDAYTCAFPGSLVGNAGATQTDEATVTAVDGAGVAVSDTDDAVVSLTDVRPTVTVEKTALPEVRAAPGGRFTFGLKITNTSFEPVTVTSIDDDVYGDLADLTSSTCAQLVGKVLAPGETVTCTFPGELTGAVGAAQTDVVTVTVRDDDDSTGTGRDDATIRLVAPGQEPTTTTTTTRPTTSTTATPGTATTRPPTATTPTTDPGQPRLASTGADPRRSGLLAGTLLGLGLLFTGLSLRTPRPRRSPT